jgi:predicted CopG family antitoxin
VIKIGTSKDELIDEMWKYKKGFEILMEYFDSISDEEKPKVHKQLFELGL